MTGFDEAWNTAWPGCPPVAGRMRDLRRERWVRFHTLPDAKRYATTPAEHAEILHRHHTLLTALAADAGTLTAITRSWSATSDPTPRHATVAATTPDATHWRSDDLAWEPGFSSWQHHYISPAALAGPALDELLLCVADDMTDGVILTDDTCAWAYHPYDGGADVFTTTTQARHELAAAHADWLAPPARHPPPTLPP
jgi:hypothetical protein